MLFINSNIVMGVYMAFSLFIYIVNMLAKIVMYPYLAT